MLEKPSSILQVNTADRGVGADKVAWNLFEAYRARGHHSQLAVGYKRSEDPDVFVLPRDQPLDYWARFWYSAGNIFSPLVGRIPGAGRLRRWMHLVGRPRRLLEFYLGREDFNFPGTWKLLESTPAYPDILHCHNLHGEYFDLGALAWLSQRIPTILTLHDAWLLSGHCAHSLDCERWKTGCGRCPDLTIYPSIRRDATAFNWQRKRDIFSKSRLFVATPCRWLMQKVEHSILAQAVVEARVIPYGVDLSFFHPVDKKMVRTKLGIPHQNTKVIVFVAARSFKNPWKDYQTMRSAVAWLSKQRPGERLFFLVVGEKAPREKAGQAIIQFIPYQKNPAVVADYYQAADVSLHAAHADTFPNVVLEALACGTPVVATATCGIPEQIEDGVTGFLTPPRDARAMAISTDRLLRDDLLRQRMSLQAANSAKRRFNLERMVDDYLRWYKKILQAAAKCAS